MIELRGDVRLLAVVGIALVFSACATRTITRTEVVGPVTDSQYSQASAPGVVEYIWEEPMVDVVDVPPGLDPEGHYYRPAHQSVVEIRQGRWKYYKNPEEANR